MGLAIGQHIGGQGHSAVQRPLKTRQGLGNTGITRLRQTLRRNLGAGQHVAKVVINLGHRLAQGRQPRLGLQSGADIGLHPVKLGLRAAHLIAATGQTDLRARIFRVRPKALHGPGDALHGPNEEGVERQIDQTAGKD